MNPARAPFTLLLAAACVLSALARSQDVAPAAPTSLDPALTGQQLAARLLAQRPANDFTNHGTLKIRGRDLGNTNLPLVCITQVSGPDWTAKYRAGQTTLVITHPDHSPARYFLTTAGEPPRELTRPDELATAFAGSDFQVGDLGLDFFQWPGQRILKRDVHRSRGCIILESSRPNPPPGGYAKVQAWIDEETLGIVEAEAYDPTGQEWKDFYPKDFTKVNGAYQVGTLVMKDELSGSKTQLDFDFTEPEK